MSLLEERKPNGDDVVAEAIAASKRATELRDAAITQLLAQREQIDRDLQTLGYRASPSGNGAKSEVLHVEPPATREFRSAQFRKLTLAEVAKVLLKEYGKLHGKEIERLAKAGGFKGGKENFQNYMPVAFKRDGGFENVGGNTWRLKEPAKQQAK
jgi:hypothetical protein